MLALFSSLARFVGIAALGAVVGSGAVPAGPTTRASGPPPRGAIGRDVGSQSCSRTLATDVSFGVIATTAGRPYFSSPCLAAEYSWASSLTYRPQYYLNLANPGHKSSNWARGGPRVCDRKPKYDPGCAYDYGYRAAAAAWGYVTAVGSSGRGRWWLDVETDNTWGYSANGMAANRAVIRGALNYLRHRHHVGAGIYTETSWWWVITGNSSSFSGTPVWGGGAGSKNHAVANCKPHSITGGPALMAQWIRNGVDHDVAC
ncbi:MAG TPA: hypothetical protein VHE56_02125 [Mycobacteriales bacterium]|nr:hypothetical protein [Mycobacteriales bacterium]